MANKKRGEVELKALGKTMIMRFGTNQICALEDDLGMGINQIAERISDPARMRISFIRTVLLHAINDPITQSIGDMTVYGAGDIIDELGLEVVGEKIGEEFNAAFPDAKESQDPPVKAG